MISCTARVGFTAALVVCACSDTTEPNAASRAAIDAPASVVIREVYGGGSNTSAVWAQDYVELFNRSALPVTLAGWSLQYASATGTGNFGATAAQRTELPDITLLPGQSYLVQEAGSGSPGAPLPSPDYVDPTPINLSASAGKLALVRSSTALGCNGSSTPCTAAAEALIVDMVGFGNANYAETRPAPAPDNATSVSRSGLGCVDTNDNGADFRVVVPSPRTFASALVDCAQVDGSGGASATGGSGTGAVGASAGASSQGGAAGETATAGTGGADDDSTEPGATRIHDIQGRGHRSPLEGTVVARVPGIVTRVLSNGYFLQDPEPDADSATSEAVFVFTNGAPSVMPGDSLLVTGRVAEYRPGCSSCSPSASAYANLTTTEIDRPSAVVRLGVGVALPAPVLVGASGRMPPVTVIDDDGVADVESPAAQFAPERDGIDFYESLEAMRVEVRDAVAVGPTSSYSELPVLAEGGVGASLRSSRGGIIVRSDDFNPERIILAGEAIPQANVGDGLPGTVTANVDYSFGSYQFLVDGPLPNLAPAALARESCELGPRSANELDIAAMNVENLDPSDSAEKFAQLAEIIVHQLNAPDILSLEEVQDDSGATNDGTVTASATLQKLFEAVTAAGGPLYQAVSIDPIDARDGGERGGNIRIVLAYRTDRGVALAGRAGADATTANVVVNARGVPELTYNPGRIDPTNPAFESSRKPLAAAFTFNGQSLFVVANHFNSKGGDQPLFGRFQPPARSSEAQRIAQANVVADFVTSITRIDPNANIVVLGDLNDFEFSSSVATIEAAGLSSLIRTLPPAERYTYVYEGNSQALDHVLASPSLQRALKGFDVVHVNAEFVEQVSDHDPAIARFALGPVPTLNVIPILECVERLGGRWYRAHFGYENPNALPVTRTIGSNNRMLPGSSNRGQPSEFLPGRQRDVTVVPFQGLLAWWLDRHVALASPLASPCP